MGLNRCVCEGGLLPHHPAHLDHHQEAAHHRQAFPHRGLHHWAFLHKTLQTLRVIPSSWFCPINHPQKCLVFVAYNRNHDCSNATALQGNEVHSSKPNNWIVMLNAPPPPPALSALHTYSNCCVAGRQFYCVYPAEKPREGKLFNPGKIASIS